MRGFTTQRTPREVITELQFVEVDCGEFHTAGIDRKGSAYAWGFNESGQIGQVRASNV